MMKNDIILELGNLNDIPSPYLNGYLDEFLLESVFIPIVESNRGCPFTCTFCNDGMGAYTKVHQFEVSRLVDEVEYIAQRFMFQFVNSLVYNSL